MALVETLTTPPLTPEQQRLVVQNQGFAFKVAWQERGCGLDEDERRSEALFGLILAAQRYDASRGYAFTTFSGYWIRACIWKAATAVNNIVRLDTTEGKRKIEPRVRRLARTTEFRHLDPAAIAAELDVRPDEVAEVITRLRARPFDVRLDAMARPPDLVDHADRADEVAEARQLVRAVEAALDRLALDDPRCADIVRGRIEHDDAPTLAELGRRYGVSRERMRQLEAKGLARVREELGL